jgi:hypothetical protein
MVPQWLFSLWTLQLFFFNYTKARATKEVWRLASDFSAEGKVAAHSQPDDQKMIVSACAAEVCHHYAPPGHFRTWALLRFPEFTTWHVPARIPTHMRGWWACFLHEVHTGLESMICMAKVSTHMCEYIRADDIDLAISFAVESFDNAQRMCI